jgi:hypothetical protein
MTPAVPQPSTSPSITRTRVSSLIILNTFYSAAPTLQLPELIALFAAPGLKALTSAMLQSPEQLA